MKLSFFFFWQVGVGEDEELIRNMASHGKQSIQSQHGKRNTSVASVAPPRGPKQNCSIENQNEVIIPTVTGVINGTETDPKRMTPVNLEKPASLREATAMGLFQRPVETNNSHPTHPDEVSGSQSNGAAPTGSAHFDAATDDIPTVGFSTPVRSAAVERSKVSTESMNSGKFIRTERRQSEDKSDKTDFSNVGFSDVITPSKRVQQDMRSEGSDLEEPLF